MRRYAVLCCSKARCCKLTGALDLVLQELLKTSTERANNGKGAFGAAPKAPPKPFKAVAKARERLVAPLLSARRYYFFLVCLRDLCFLS